MIRCYFYQKEPSHAKKDTDRRILQSAASFCQSDMTTLPQDAIVLRTDLGKPYISGISKPPYIGVTHTEELLVIAVGNTPFGIDCEKTNRTVLRFQSLAKRYFSENEQRHIASFPEEKQAAQFLDIWVKKEAYVKHLGTGISDIAAADTFAVDGVFEQVIYDGYLIYLFKPNGKA